MALADELALLTRVSELVEPLPGNRVRCLACGHRCPIADGQQGVCKVRFHRAGKLYAPYGYVNSIQCDPIEKKPFFHVRPGSTALSFGMIGCSFHCAYCQNWISSQVLRDRRADTNMLRIDAEEIVQLGRRYRAASVVSTYNEPLITAEWAADVFQNARAAGLMTGIVSNGNATPEVLNFLKPCIDFIKVDLKSFDDRHYRELGGRLGPVLDTIGMIHDLGVWLEIVTLVVPGLNDSAEELASIAKFLAGISTDIPWHVTAFYPAYRMTETPATEAATVLAAVQTGKDAGLRFVYGGNIREECLGAGDTMCPGCGKALVRRRGFRTMENAITASGRCPDCATVIAGRWGP